MAWRDREPRLTKRGVVGEILDPEVFERLLAVVLGAGGRRAPVCIDCYRDGGCPEHSGPESEVER